MAQPRVLEEQSLLIYDYKEVYFQLSVVHKEGGPFTVVVYLPRPLSDVVGRQHHGSEIGYSTYTEARSAGERMAVELIERVSSPH